MEGPLLLLYMYVQPEEIIAPHKHLVNNMEFLYFNVMTTYPR